MKSQGSTQPQQIAPSLARFLVDRYPAVKARYPDEGRRKWRLRVADAFWALPFEQKAAYAIVCQDLPRLAIIANEDAEFVTDDDPLHALTADVPGLGILLRTDYSNEDAWQTFGEKLQEGEAEFSVMRTPEDATMTDAQGSISTKKDVDEAMDQDEGDDDKDEDEGESSASLRIFTVINAALSDRARFANLSNLGALRLLNDVDIRPAPTPPPGTKRIKPPNRLVDHDGWQEVYTGKTVWIYDARSNTDQCVRLVSQQSDFYGTATADSWRARVSHICELQVNLAAGALTIDFGGLDRWDYNERSRNLAEAMLSLT
ncbi:uncharacterized protein LAESUDRAFT_644173 [Laetiporus sulphureus 93-53]|uniref:Uncharacterized protein n=1 Tax=Laetiporus sulphureus 93-53 TaxID=1314785 RepID=A0A165GYL4_9APHY|nr:uncharacterized protein LAESUDRAFT_644173 [Laetiporus sulphureus 93-53]KZT11003.1 hypothetical protein LAESUDRAFT_644173 [Laetiporus sulphureus 93-53]